MGDTPRDGTYRKVYAQLWNDARFRELSDDGKLIFLCVLTHPSMTALGAMRGTAAGLAAELGWTSTARARRALGEAEVRGMVHVNDGAAYIGVPSFLRDNEPNGPNAVKKAWPRALELIPECPERHIQLRRCLVYLEGRTAEFRAQLGGVLDAIRDAIPDDMRDGVSHAIRDGMHDAVRDPSAIQEQEQEQEQERGRSISGKTSG